MLSPGTVITKPLSLTLESRELLAALKHVPPCDPRIPLENSAYKRRGAFDKTRKNVSTRIYKLAGVIYRYGCERVREAEDIEMQVDDDRRQGPLTTRSRTRAILLSRCDRIGRER